MKHFSLTAAILDFSRKMKPLLVKLLPITFLRRVKKSMVDSTMSKLDTEFLPFSRNSCPDGINLIGYIRGEFGLGQSCRLLADGIQESGLSFTIYNYEQISAIRCNDHSWTHKITNTTPYNINLIHIQPYEMPLAFLKMDRKIWDKRYNIAFWLWELEQFPPQWENALKLVDEVWTPSEFSSESIRKATHKPVHTIPYALDVLDCGQYGREHFHLPADKFLFLCMYDCNSTMERKNPMAAINAYKQAFSLEHQDAGLVIKVNNPQQKDLQIIHSALAGYSGIYIIADVLDKTQVNALIACVDVYVTLHRSEGFGLVPAEAMLLGTPVIATNWSSNTEFMNKDVACMVDSSFVIIDKDCGPYQAGNRWADPDLEQASRYMQRLFQDSDYCQRIAESAKTYIKDKLSSKRAATLIKNRIAEIYR